MSDQFNENNYIEIWTYDFSSYFLGQFNELVGTQIPFSQLGYPTLIELLKSIPGLQKEGFNQEGDMVVSLDASQSGMSHIQDMVKRQQGHKAKQRSTAARYVVSRAAPVRYPELLEIIFYYIFDDIKHMHFRCSVEATLLQDL